MLGAGSHATLRYDAVLGAVPGKAERNNSISLIRTSLCAATNVLEDGHSHPNISAILHVAITPRTDSKCMAMMSSLPVSSRKYRATTAVDFIGVAHVWLV